MNNKAYAAIAGIEEKYIEASEKYGDVSAAFQSRTRINRRILLAAACFLLIVAAAFPLKNVIQKSNQRSISNPPKDHQTGLQAWYAGPVNYSELTANGHMLKGSNGMGAMSYGSFSEQFISDSPLIIEGRVLESHTKEYHFVTETEGKFEYAGQKMKITYEPKTLITTVQIEKIWRGENFSEGDVIVIEDEIAFLSDYYELNPGSTYSLCLSAAEKDNVLVFSGLTDNEILIEGDNHRESPYSISYPFQPSIEKTVTGDYIVPGTWKSIAKETDVDILLDPAECDGFSPEDTVWYQLGGLKLVSASDFESRMSALLS